MIPWNERHLKMILNEWVIHYNNGRPHMSLGPGVPVGTDSAVPISLHRPEFARGYVVRSKAILSGLHHEYTLEKLAA